jgi:beta-glucosidase
VELYTSRHSGSVTPSVRKLRRFAKVPLGAGERRDVRFQLARDDFAFVAADGKRTVEPGTFTIAVGNLKQPFTLR